MKKIGSVKAVHAPRLGRGKKPGPSRPHFRMRHLSPMGRPSNISPPGESGDAAAAFPNSIPGAGGGMAFNPGVGAGDLGGGGAAPDGGGGPPAAPAGGPPMAGM
jgi:hypothetical protein